MHVRDAGEGDGAGADLQRDLANEELPFVVLVIAADLLAPGARHARAAQPQLAKALHQAA